MKPTGFLAALLAALAMAAPAVGAGPETVPFRTSNQSPLTRVFGLPSLGDAAVLDRGTKDLTLSLDWANFYADDSSARERLVLDGETYRLNLTGRWGVAGRLELGVEVPYYFQNGGILDNFIDGYHSIFGFPRGGRDQVPTGRLLLSYQRDGRERLRVDRNGSGIGDVRLTAGRQLCRGAGDEPGAVALRASLKLPTGESADLFGSGGTDFAAWLSANYGGRTGYGDWGVFGGAGFLGLSDGDFVPEQQRNAVLFGTLGAGWTPLRRLTLRVQFEGHTPFYRDSDLVEFDSASVQVVTGGTLSFTDRTALDIGVSEDLAVKTAPDVVFHFALRHRF